MNMISLHVTSVTMVTMKSVSCLVVMEVELCSYNHTKNMWKHSIWTYECYISTGKIMKGWLTCYLWHVQMSKMGTFRYVTKNSIYHNRKLHYWIQHHHYRAGLVFDLSVTKNAQYRSRIGNPWGIYYESFGEKWRDEISTDHCICCWISLFLAYDPDERLV